MVKFHRFVHKHGGYRNGKKYHRLLAAVGGLPIASVVGTPGVDLVGVVGDAVGLPVDDGRVGGGVVGWCPEKDKVMNLHDTLTMLLFCCLKTLY